MITSQYLSLAEALNYLKLVNFKDKQMSNGSGFQLAKRKFLMLPAWLKEKSSLCIKERSSNNSGVHRDWF